MKHSSQRILTTHTGSLPRPAELVDRLWRHDEGEISDPAVFNTTVTAAVAEVVAAQIEAGIDIVNDGEAGKVSYFSYVADRLTGFSESEPTAERVPQDMAEFPGFLKSRPTVTGSPRRLRRPACTGPVSYCSPQAVALDIDNLRAATRDRAVEERFLSSASPGLIAMFMANKHYGSREEYLLALADAMKTEYDAINAAGLILQLDCPDLALSYNAIHYEAGVAGFRRLITENIAALNHATRDIAPDRMRMHLCWGNYEGPHHHDIPFRDIVDLILTARPAAISFEAANPRHEHEYTLWDEVSLPDGKIILPGVIDSTTNFIEHPELVAQRLMRFAERVGRENVIASSDCGFSSGAGLSVVDDAIAWAKLSALSEGARLASNQLWAAGR